MHKSGGVRTNAIKFLESLRKCIQLLNVKSQLFPFQQFINRLRQALELEV